MKQQEQIMKAALLLIDSIKDTLEKNVVAAVTSGKLQIDKAALPMLTTVIKTSVDDGYQRAYSSVSRAIATVLNTESKKVVPTQKKDKK